MDLRLLEYTTSIPGVTAVHDLHVWTITSGLDAMSVHLVVSETADGRQILRAARQAMADDFNIDHVTIQIEDEAFGASEKTLRV